jgi:hypothetical protein
MAINVSSLAGLTTQASSLSGLLLAVPQLASIFQSGAKYTQGYQPQNPTNSNGTPNTSLQLPQALLFHYEGEQTVALESDITDHYIEDNTAIQDQIALRPETVTTHGFIGELNDIAPPVLATLQQVAEKLTVFSPYLPVLSASALLAYNQAFQLYQSASSVVNSSVSAWNALTGGNGESVIGSNGINQVAGSQSKQQAIFQQFYGYWRNRTLFTVQTPWAVFQNMAIKSLRAIQDEQTNVITDFEVTFKMIRTASSQTTQLFASGRNAIQSATQTNFGASNGTPSISLSTGLVNSGLGAGLGLT